MIEIKVDAKRRFKDRTNEFDSPNAALKEAAQVVYMLRDMLVEYLGQGMATYALMALGTNMVTGKVMNPKRSHDAEH